MGTEDPVNLALLQSAAATITPLSAITALLGLLVSMAGGLTAYSAVAARIGRSQIRPATARGVAATAITIIAGTVLLWFWMGTSLGDGLAGLVIHLGSALMPALLFPILGALSAANASVQSGPESWSARAGAVIADALAGWLPVRTNGNGHDQDAEEPEFEITMASGEEVEAEEREYIENILEMGDTTAHVVMTPRPDVVALDISLEPDQIVQAVAYARFSRFPVYEESIDNIIGVLHLRDLLEFLARGKGMDKLDLHSMLMKPLFIPESKKVDDVLRELQVRKSHMAIVLDEYGGTEGILTIEDLLEEIVGEIQDEFDDESAQIHQRDDGSWVVNGQMQLDELNEALGTEVESEEVDTLGGFIIHMLGHIPENRESIDHSGYRYSVLSIDKQRVDLVLVSPLTESDIAG